VNDWFNWVRLLILIPGASYSIIRTFRDLPRGHVGRSWLPFLGLYYVISAGKLICEDWSS
jgi:hypothetical protein